MVAILEHGNNSSGNGDMLQHFSLFIEFKKPVALEPAPDISFGVPKNRRNSSTRFILLLRHIPKVKCHRAVRNHQYTLLKTAQPQILVTVFNHGNDFGRIHIEKRAVYILNRKQPAFFLIYQENAIAIRTDIYSSVFVKGHIAYIKPLATVVTNWHKTAVRLIQLHHFSCNSYEQSAVLVFNDGGSRYSRQLRCCI